MIRVPPASRSTETGQTALSTSGRGKSAAGPLTCGRPDPILLRFWVVSVVSSDPIEIAPAVAGRRMKGDTIAMASAQKAGKDMRLGGSYEFNGFQLKLAGRGKKPEQQYGAMVNSFTKTLELTKDDKKQVLKKQE